MIVKKDKLYMYILESKNIEDEVIFILYEESLDNTKFDIYKISPKKPLVKRSSPIPRLVCRQAFRTDFPAFPIDRRSGTGGG